MTVILSVLSSAANLAISCSFGSNPEGEVEGNGPVSLNSPFRVHKARELLVTKQVVKPAARLCQIKKVQISKNL